jgi:hypothetical protein
LDAVSTPNPGFLARIVNHPRAHLIVGGVWGVAGLLRLLEGRTGFLEWYPLVMAALTILWFRGLEKPEALKPPQNSKLTREQYEVQLRGNLRLFFILGCVVLGIQVFSLALSLSPAPPKKP